VNSNIDKFLKEELDYMFNHAKDQLTKFGYEETFTCIKVAANNFIDEFNEKSL
jgi:hypothetical protein